MFISHVLTDILICASTHTHTHTHIHTNERGPVAVGLDTAEDGTFHCLSLCKMAAKISQHLKDKDLSKFA